MEPKESNRKGFTSVESIGLVGTLVGALFAAITYVYSTFVTHKDLDKLEQRLIRIEMKLDEVTK